jgi:ASC-1-like (ASCH) protein
LPHHLVVLREPYLSLMLAGRKRVECRLSRIRRPPFEAVFPGDLLWFKLPSQPIRAVAIAGRCLFQELRAPEDVPRALGRYSSLICAEEGFFGDAARWARFASLVWIDAVLALGMMHVRKSDQRAWVVLDRAPFPGMGV